MKKNSKIIVIMMILFFITPITSRASIDTDFEISSRWKNTFAPVANPILGALQVAGIFVAVAMIMIIGIRYMISSVDEKAELKNKLIYYFIGAILVGSAPAVIGLISKILDF